MSVVSAPVEVEPETVGVTAPMLLLILNEVALVVVHESVDEPPEVTEVGEAERVQVGFAGGGVTVTDVEQLACPPGPVTVMW